MYNHQLPKIYQKNKPMIKKKKNLHNIEIPRYILKEHIINVDKFYIQTNAVVDN